MYWLDLADNAQLFFLLFARIMSLIMIAPIISSEAIPSIAKVGLAFLVAAGIYPWASKLGFVIPQDVMAYVLLLIGEIFIGIIIGFFFQLIYSGFQTAGQFFSLQMGFGASEVFDPLSNEELPLLGQFFNLIAMYVFLASAGMQKMFLHGVYGSFLALKAQDLASSSSILSLYFVGALGRLFTQAFMLALPIVGSLFLISIGMGLLSKAAPQMNLLSMGFPINLLVAFALMVFILPNLMETFSGIVDYSFKLLDDLFRNMAGQVPSSRVPVPGGQP